MLEVAITETTRKAIEAAHRERSEAFTALIRPLAHPIRALAPANWPQVGARRWNAPPQGCPAGQ